MFMKKYFPLFLFLALSFKTLAQQGPGELYPIFAVGKTITGKAVLLIDAIAAYYDPMKSGYSGNASFNIKTHVLHPASNLTMSGKDALENAAGYIYTGDMITFMPACTGQSDKKETETSKIRKTS